jgi:hypothetical protein
VVLSGWRTVAVFLYAFLAKGLCFPGPVAAGDGVYLARLLERVRQERLYERPEWRSLLHYRASTLSSGVQSEVAEPAFFLSPQGKNDPQAELNATLEHFFASDASDPDRSSQCRFPARYHWLKQVLDIESDRLPELGCEQFHRWFEEMNPGRITLIFPAAYLNNPASMFGHTLLRVDVPGQGPRTELIAYTINYAADTRDQKGALYAFKGLFGGYKGRFNVAPYYSAVKKYGDIENRDIWEYRLNLTPEESRQLLRHVWEMRSAWFVYYFLRENCSYELLSLLEAARPGLRLTDRLPWWAIPSETVRAVAEAGLLSTIRYRPARNTVLQQRMRLMEPGHQVLAKRLALGEAAAGSQELQWLAPVEQARIQELAFDYLAYRQSPRFGGVEPNAGRVSELLTARSRLDVPDQTPAIAAPKVWPGAGHDPARARISYGIEDRQQFVELAGSPAYHELMDPEGGFTRGASVNLSSGALRYYPQESKVELDRFEVIDIMSLTPWNRFLHPVSWKATVGLERKHLSATDRLLVGALTGAAGLSRAVTPDTTAYAFTEGTVELSGHFAYYAAPGLGARLGVVHDFSDHWRTGAYLRWQLFFLHELRNDSKAVVENRYTLNGNNTAGLDLEWKYEFGNGYPGVKLYWQHYF